MMDKVLAVIKGVGFGNRDVGKAVLWFSTYVDECTAALQVISPPDALDIIQKYGVRDVHDLEGKTCWVILDKSKNTIIFDSPAKI